MDHGTDQVDRRPLVVRDVGASAAPDGNGRDPCIDREPRCLRPTRLARQPVMDDVSAGGGGLDRADIIRLLEAVSLEAHRREVSVSLFLVGGAAMALAYSTSRATKDLDGIFEPKAVVYQIAARVAEQWPEYGATQYLIEAIASGRNDVD